MLFCSGIYQMISASGTSTLHRHTKDERSRPNDVMNRGKNYELFLNLSRLKPKEVMKFAKTQNLGVA